MNHKHIEIKEMQTNEMINETTGYKVNTTGIPIKQMK